MKEQNYTLYSLKKRLLASIILVGFIFFLLVVRLCYIQVIKSEHLLNLASEQWSRDLPINAERGTIFDCNGEILAVSYTTYDVYVRASNVKEPAEVTSLLCDILKLDFDKVYTKVTNKKTSESLIKMQISKEDASKIRKANLKGIYLSENTKRYYPYGNLLSQVLGYTTIDNIGQAGLELYYDKFLKGVNGEYLVQSDISGRELDNNIDTYIPALAGYDLTLTIDYRIQMMVEQAANLIMQNENPKSASIMVMNPKTGEIIASTCKPSFDLNNLPRDNISILNSQTKNLTIVDVYEPGSTFKVLTTAAALEEKVTSMTDGFYDPGYRVIDGEKIHCWKHIGHGNQTLVDGLNNSCNSVFLDLSLRLGKQKMYEYFEKFGFGNLTNVDFPGESSGIIMNYATARKVDYARMGFGQAIAVTPLQQITAISSVLNDGNLMQPYFVKTISSKYSNYQKTVSPIIKGKTISADTSEKIRYMMEQVIINANAISAFIPGYRVSGKTGTSQKYEGNKIAQGKFISSFVGAFPADNPDYVILVVVDEPSSGNYFGSVVATPYAKLVLEGIISYKNYPSQNLEEDLKKMELSIEMPNLVGKSLSYACGTLSNLGLQCEIQGEGGIVKEQYYPPKTMLYKNALVVLTTD